MNGPFEHLSRWKMAYLFIATATHEDTMAFCHRFGLLSPVKVCACGRNMLLQNWNGNTDGKRWCCNGRDCRCAERLRNGSIFAGSHLSLQQLVRLMYLYSIGYTKQADLMFHLDIISQHSIIKWKCNIRDVFAQYFIANPQTVGGFGHMVEIDECLLVRRK